MLHVITGPMGSGKSGTLIKRIQDDILAGKKVLAFKHFFDKRFGEDVIASRNGTNVKCIPVKNPGEILDYIRDANCKYDVIYIDECQFFENGLVGLCNYLMYRGYDIVACGLDLDFRQDPFGEMPGLLALADNVEKLTATCSICGKPARYTQKLAGSCNTVEVGSTNYTARCLDHHVIKVFTDEQTRTEC